MLEIAEAPITRMNLIDMPPEATDPPYLAWKRNKIQATLDNDHPERRRLAEAVFSDLYDGLLQ